MASALLLTAAPLLPSQKTQVRGFMRNLGTSFHGQVMFNRGSTRGEFSNTGGSRFVVASVLGRRVNKTETVIPEPDYRIPIVLLGLAGGFAYTNNLLPAAPVGLLGLLLLFQTTRVRFVFDDEALEVKVGDQLEESGENVFVGGKNRWKYSTFVNWELWWPNFPILGNGTMWLDGSCPRLLRLGDLQVLSKKKDLPSGSSCIVVGDNGKQLYDVMVERAGPSKTSGPKKS